MRFYVLLFCTFTTVQLTLTLNQNVIPKDSSNTNAIQRPKRLTNFLTGGLGLASSLLSSAAPVASVATTTAGSKASIFQLLGRLFNLATSEQNLLLKRRFLNLVMRTSSLILKFLPSEPVQTNSQLFGLGKFKKTKPSLLSIIPILTQAPLSTTESYLEAESAVVTAIIKPDEEIKNKSKRAAEDDIESTTHKDAENQQIFTKEDLKNYRNYIEDVNRLIKLLEVEEVLGNEHQYVKRSSSSGIKFEEVQLIKEIAEKMQDLVNYNMEHADEQNKNEDLEKMADITTVSNEDLIPKIIENEITTQQTTFGEEMNKDKNILNTMVEELNLMETEAIDEILVKADDIIKNNENNKLENVPADAVTKQEEDKFEAVLGEMEKILEAEDYNSLTNLETTTISDINENGKDVFVMQESIKVDQKEATSINGIEIVSAKIKGTKNEDIFDHEETATVNMKEVNKSIDGDNDKFLENMEMILAENETISPLTNIESTSILAGVKEMNSNMTIIEDKTIEENTNSQYLSTTHNPTHEIHVEVHKTITEDASSQIKNDTSSEVGIPKNLKKPGNLVIIYPEGLEDVLDEIVVTSPTLVLIKTMDEKNNDTQTTLADGIIEESIYEETIQTTELPGENLSDLKEHIINNINQEGKYVVEDVPMEDDAKKVVYVVVHKFLLKNNESSSNQDELEDENMDLNQNNMVQFINENENDFTLEPQERVKREKIEIKNREVVKNKSESTLNILGGNKHKRQLGSNYFAGVTSRFRQISPSFEGFSSSNFHSIPFTNNYHYGSTRFPAVFKKNNIGYYSAKTSTQKVEENTTAVEDKNKATANINKDHYFNYFPFYERRVNFTSNTFNLTPVSNGIKNFENKKEGITNATIFVFKSLPLFENKTSFTSKGFEEKNTKSINEVQNNLLSRFGGTNKGTKDNVVKYDSGTLFAFKSLPLYDSFDTRFYQGPQKNTPESSSIKVDDKTTQKSNVGGNQNSQVKESSSTNMDDKNEGVKTTPRFGFNTVEYENIKKAALENRKKLLGPLLQKNDFKPKSGNNKSVLRYNPNRVLDKAKENKKVLDEVQQRVHLLNLFLNEGMKAAPLKVEVETFRGFDLNDLLPSDKPADKILWARPTFSRSDVFDESIEEAAKVPVPVRNDENSKTKLKWVSIENPKDVHRTKLNTTILSFALKGLKEKNERNRLNFRNPIIPSFKPQEPKGNGDSQAQFFYRQKLYYPESSTGSPNANSYIKPYLSETKEEGQLKFDPPNPAVYELVHSNFGRRFKSEERQSNQLPLETEDVLFYDKNPKTAFTSYGVSINK